MGTEDQDALLTKAQRSFLSGETDYGKRDAAGRTARSRMRRRLYEGLLDFHHLAAPTGLDDHDVEQLRESLHNDLILDDTLKEIVSFIYRLSPNMFERIIEEGAEAGVERFSPAYKLGEVQISIQRRSRVISRALRKMEDDRELSGNEIRVLLEADEIPEDELGAYVRDHPQGIDDYASRYR